MNRKACLTTIYKNMYNKGVKYLQIREGYHGDNRASIYNRLAHLFQMERSPSV